MAESLIFKGNIIGDDVTLQSGRQGFNDIGMGIHEQSVAKIRDPDIGLETPLRIGHASGNGVVDGELAEILGDLTVEVAKSICAGEQKLGLVFEFETTVVGR
jgi:hypothetical protein